MLNLSLPSRGRGLKYPKPTSSDHSNSVAPFAGAWIEIKTENARQALGGVAPFAGAWIEISYKLLTIH